jgi:hypothetical protein
VKAFKITKLTADIKRENEKVFKFIKECYLFSASCYIKMEQFEFSVLMMNELLTVEPHNPQALYLRGKS